MLLQNKANLEDIRMKANCRSEMELWRRMPVAHLRKQSQFSGTGSEAA